MPGPAAQSLVLAVPKTLSQTILMLLSVIDSNAAALLVRKWTAVAQPV